MKITVKVCIITPLLWAVSFAQAPDTIWTNTFDGTPVIAEIGYYVQETSDGCYFIVGEDCSGQRMMLIKTDPQGNLIWSKQYGYGDCRGYSGQQTHNGNYIVTGTSDDFVILLKADAYGDEIWHRMFSQGKYGSSIRETTTDHGYIITGLTPETQDVLLLKTDIDGYYQWHTTFGGSQDDVGLSVRQTNDLGYIIGGWTRSFGNGSQVYLIKTDSSGNEEWTTTWGDIYADAVYSVQQTLDSGYIATGFHKPTSAYDYDLLLIKLFPSGKVDWYKLFDRGGIERGFWVEQTTDGGYIIVGTDNYNSGSADVWLIKTDASGNMQWERTFGRQYKDYGHCVGQTTDGGYIITGNTQINPVTPSDEIYLIKTTPEALESNDAFSLAFNGNRHLVRKPNAEEQHLVYVASDRVCYCRSQDGGTTWSDVTNLGKGKYPAIALDCADSLSVTWTDDEGGLWYRRQLDEDEWSNIYHLWNPGANDLQINSPPSIVIDHRSISNKGHILVTRSGGEPTRDVDHTVEDYTFDIDDPAGGSFVLIEQTQSPYQYPPLRSYPSIARCEVDNSFHAAWQRVDTICYAKKLSGQAWNVWGPQFGDDGLQSAHPFVETYGDSIYVVWQRTADEEVYRGARHVQDISFPNGENISQTSVLASLYPVNASGFFTAYAEEPTTSTPYETYYKVRPEDDRRLISNTAYNSLYPQCAARFTLANYLYMAWQDGDEAPYEIRFKKIRHEEMKNMAYLSSVNGHNPPSPYLVARDSFISNWQIPVDIGNMSTTYQFPLIPGYAYKAKAVVYHEGSGPWSGRITVDNNVQFVVTYNANVPETLECWIPPALYADSVLTVSFNRITGNFAAIGPIYIYRYEYENGGGGPMAQQNQPTHNTSLTVFPNPFTENLNITYQITRQNGATLILYDITGRLVKQLDLPANASVNHITWDGVDDHGRTVPSGVYFLRIDNPDSGDMLCQKVLRIE